MPGKSRSMALLTLPSHYFLRKISQFLRVIPKCWGTPIPILLGFKQNNSIRKSQVNDQCVGHVGTMMISSFGAKIPQFLRGQAVTFFNVERDSLMVSSVVTRFIITITHRFSKTFVWASKKLFDEVIKQKGNEQNSVSCKLKHIFAKFSLTSKATNFHSNDYWCTVEVLRNSIVSAYFASVNSVNALAISNAKPQSNNN